jgi:hypothetical protein
MVDSTPSASTDATELQKHRQTGHLQQIKDICPIVQTNHRLPYLGHFVVSAVLSRQVVQKALQASQMSRPSVGWEAHEGVALRAVQPDWTIWGRSPSPERPCCADVRLEYHCRTDTRSAVASFA